MHAPLHRLARHLRRAVGLVAIASAAVAQAGEKLQCVSLDYPPLIYMDGHGRVTGIAVDVVRQALAADGWDVEVEIFPWARALELMRSGQRDCVFTIFKTPEREEFLDFSSKPLLLQPIALYARKGRSVAFDGDLAGLREKSIAVAQSVNYGQRFESERGNLKLSQAYTPAQSFQLLSLGRVDLTISNVYLAAHQLTMAAGDMAANIEQLRPPVEVVTSYIAFAKGRHPKALKDFDQHIDDVLRRDNGRAFRRILDTHNVPAGLRAGLLK